MVHAILSSLSITLDAGNTQIVHPDESLIDADATVTCTNMPSIDNNNFCHFMTSIEYLRDVTETQVDVNGDLITVPALKFRIKKTDFEKFRDYMNTIYVPSWAETNADSQDGVNNAKIRADIPNNNLDLTVVQVNPFRPAPGNFNNSSHGSLPDLYIGYIAAALTGAHEGRAILLNEDAIFNKLAASTASDDTYSFGEAFVRTIFFHGNLNADLSTFTETIESEEYYVTPFVNQDSDVSPLAELYEALYLNASERFTNHAVSTYHTIPLEAGDTLSMKVTISGNLQMNKSDTDDATNQNIMRAITNRCNSSPATFTAPVDYDRKPNEVESENSNVVVSQQNHDVTIILRPQIYQITLSC